MASIFTQIIQGQLPAYKLYEDDQVIAILAKDQVTLGHTLVIPKAEVDHWTEVPPALFAHLQTKAQVIGRALRLVTGCRRILTVAVGYEVQHYHLHLIPSQSMADLNFAKGKTYPDQTMKEIQHQVLDKIREINL